MKNNHSITAITLTMCFALIFSGCKKDDENAISMSELENGIVKITGANGQTIEAVDLGIPFGTLWAKCNLGAESPEQAGTFYSWGETSSKIEYNDNNYAFNNPQRKGKFIKYVIEEDDSSYDGKNTLEPEDDAATLLLGREWHIPTHNDFQDLLDCTEKKWCKLNGVWGFKFTSTRKGYENNSIFISASGCIDFERHLFKNEYGFYWSSTLDKTYSDYAIVLWLDNKNGQNVSVINSIKDRYNGLPIRPVTTKK